MAIDNLTAEFVFSLTQASPRTVLLEWETRDGTAVANIDYVPASGRLIFEPGETTKTVVVQVLQPAGEERKFFTVAITDATNASIDESVPGQVAIMPNSIFRGPRGYEGGRGARGMSAYEEAVAGGRFSGTYDQWLTFLKAGGFNEDLYNDTDQTKGAELVRWRGRGVGKTLDSLASEINQLPAYLEPKGAASERVFTHNNDASAHPELTALVSREANRAQAAADSAKVAAGVFATVAAGIAGTTNGAFFNVLSGSDDESILLYRNNAGAPVFMKSYPSSRAVELIAKDPQRPVATTVSGENEELLVAILDALSRRTWLEARATDGGPTQWAIKLLREALGTLSVQVPGLLVAVSDSNGVLTDLAVRDTDGQVPDWVMDRWAARLIPLLSGRIDRIAPMYFPDVRGSNTTILGTDSYVRDGEVLPVLPNIKQWAGWGSSTIAQFSEMTALAAQYGATYYNGGQGSEWSTHAGARLGSIPARLKVVGGVIPASGAITVTCSNVGASQYFKPTVGKLAGVVGTLTATDTAWTFTRSANGSAVLADAEYPFIPTEGCNHRADITFLNLGKNDINAGQSADSVIAQIDAAYDWLSPLVKRVVVMGNFTNVNTPAGSPDMLKIAAINDHCAQRYGRQYFDLGGYLNSAAVWTDTGITPTAADTAQQSIGNLAPSLSSDNAAHMNATTRAAVQRKLKTMITGLGWF